MAPLQRTICLTGHTNSRGRSQGDIYASNNNYSEPWKHHGNKHLVSNKDYFTGNTTRSEVYILICLFQRKSVVFIASLCALEINTSTTAILGKILPKYLGWERGNYR